MHSDTQPNLPVPWDPFIASGNEEFDGMVGQAGALYRVVSMDTCLDTWPGHGGEEETLRWKSFHRRVRG